MRENGTKNLVKREKKKRFGKLQAERKDEFADLLNMMSAKLRKG